MLCELAIGFSALLLVPVGLLGAFIIVRKRIRSRDDVPGLHRPNWDKDVVYIVQFPSAPHVRTISPFALKLETWLRVNKIKFEPVYSLKFSSAKGQIPYIELNGMEYADSNQIITKLTNHFGVAIDNGLTKEQLALSHMTTVTLENHTAVAGFYWRYGFNMYEFTDLVCKGRMPDKALMFWKRFQPFTQRFKTRWHGLARHTDEEVAEFSCQDIQALSDLLGDKDYFFGNQPKSLDCTVFGHLAQFIYIPMAFPQQIYIKKHCYNLIQFVDRMRDTIWPDWEEMCSKDCMRGRMGKDKATFDSIW